MRACAWAMPAGSGACAAGVWGDFPRLRRSARAAVNPGFREGGRRAYGIGGGFTRPWPDR